MAKIEVGRTATGPLWLDIDMMLRTRLLIQANSGGGKSWLLRRLAEQLFGKIQVIIIDPEGEFATLRERYGYVLVGKGGETPADTRSTELVAHKLLELNASAVCDLFEMKPPERRHEWVKGFLDALIDAPKRLWHPVVVIVDESHQFCPEKGAGESIASSAMIDLATRGRKRGFAAVFATQRLGKLRKDAAAELTNALIGRTWLDVDQERAANQLGIGSGKGVRQDFYNEIKMLQEGQFFALGRALSVDRVLVKSGEITTTHPEAGSAKHSAAAPPTPDKIKHLLPKLSDLPKEAEEKAQTEADLKRRIAELERDLRATKNMVPVAEVKNVEVPILTKEQTELLEVLTGRVEQALEYTSSARADIAKAVELAGDVQKELGALRAAVNQAHGRVTPAASRSGVPVAPAARASGAGAAMAPRQSGSHVLPAARQSSANLGPRPAAANGHDAEPITGPQQRILDAIAWLESLGIDNPEQVAVAFLAGYSIGGGAFNNPRGRLRSRGYIEYVNPDRVRLTEEGRAHARYPDTALTTEELQARVLSRLPGPERRLLEPLLPAYPTPMTCEEHAKLAGYELGGGAYNNPRGRLRTLGLVDYPSPGYIVARPVLFLQ